MNNRNKEDYLGNLKNTYILVEKIKSYYASRGYPVSNMRFTIEKDVDRWGTKFYAIRSNISFDIRKEALIVTPPAKV